MLAWFRAMGEFGVGRFFETIVLIFCLSAVLEVKCVDHNWRRLFVKMRFFCTWVMYFLYIGIARFTEATRFHAFQSFRQCAIVFLMTNHLRTSELNEIFIILDLIGNILFRLHSDLYGIIMSQFM